MAPNLVQIENDSEINQRLEAERARMRKIAGLDPPKHFHRPELLDRNIFRNVQLAVLPLLRVAIG